MFRNSSTLARVAIARGIFLALATFFILAECKSISKLDTKIGLIDPLKPVASEQQYITLQSDQPRLQYQLVAAQPQEIVQYAAPNQPHQPIVTSHVEPRQAEYAIKRDNNEQHLYGSQERPQLLLQQQNHQETGPQNHINCNQKHEYAALSNLLQQDQNRAAPYETATGSPAIEQPLEATSKEYPGEILYVDQYGNAASASGTQDLVSGNQAADGSSSLSNVAQMITKNSGMPATILTEIPIKDMPLGVLEKLKKDYGVKVVATRERPGANLVINCDDQPNSETSICSKQSGYNNGYNMASYSHDSVPVNHPVEDQASAMPSSSERPYIPRPETREYEPNYANVQPREESYPTRGESYPTRGENYPTREENYPTRGENYSTRGENYPTRGENYPTRESENAVRETSEPTPNEEQGEGYNNRNNNANDNVNNNYGAGDQTSNENLEPNNQKRPEYSADREEGRNQEEHAATQPEEGAQKSAS